MRFRWPLMLRSTHAAAIDAQLRRHHALAGDLHDKLNRATAERKGLEAELRDTREVHARLLDTSSGNYAAYDTAIEDLTAQLASLGYRTPHDWAAAAPPETNTVIVADYHGVQVKPTE